MQCPSLKHVDSSLRWTAGADNEHRLMSALAAISVIGLLIRPKADHCKEVTMCRYDCKLLKG